MARVGKVAHPWYLGKAGIKGGRAQRSLWQGCKGACERGSGPRMEPADEQQMQHGLGGPCKGWLQKKPPAGTHQGERGPVLVPENDGGWERRWQEGARGQAREPHGSFTRNWSSGKDPKCVSAQLPELTAGPRGAQECRRAVGYRDHV